ncbi:Uncharacterised protein [Mycobacteroides abscessus]|nr:Uncharacterised protein [Mycobacteroides abscessus]
MIQNPKYRASDQKYGNNTAATIKHSSMLSPMPDANAKTVMTAFLVLKTSNCQKVWRRTPCGHSSGDLRGELETP